MVSRSFGGFFSINNYNITQKHSLNTMATRIQACIGNNYHRSLETRDLAHHLAFSVSRTCVVVQAVCHSSFKYLLNLERIRHAKLYLEQTDLRIKEIALLCGFASSEHFVRTFQQYEKRSPGNWRKIMQNSQKNNSRFSPSK